MAEFYSFIKSLWVVWMFLLFVGIVIWVLLPRNRRRFSRAAQIPLDDDEQASDSGRSDKKSRNAGTN